MIKSNLAQNAFWKDKTFIWPNLWKKPSPDAPLFFSAVITASISWIDTLVELCSHGRDERTAAFTEQALLSPNFWLVLYLLKY